MRLGKSGTNFTKMAGRRSITITDEDTSLRKYSKNQIEKYYSKGEFQKGSMEPKIIAAIHFLKHHGEKVVITSIPYIEKALNQTAGTIIRNGT